MARKGIGKSDGAAVDIRALLKEYHEVRKAIRGLESRWEELESRISRAIAVHHGVDEWFVFGDMAVKVERWGESGEDDELTFDSIPVTIVSSK